MRLPIRSGASRIGGGWRAQQGKAFAMQQMFSDPARVQAYLDNGPPAFAPGHAGMLQMVSVLLEERLAARSQLLVVGAGGGIEVRYLAGIAPHWRFVGIDPAPAMLELARATAGAAAGDRLELIEGTVDQAPAGPFDAATCILVLGLIADDGSKLATLRAIRQRLKSGAPFLLVDQCIDLTAADAPMRLDRYAAYARRSGVDERTVAEARDAIGKLSTMVPAFRNEQLLDEAGFSGQEQFYQGMAWRGWIAYA